jgi:hypothetical protein
MLDRARARKQTWQEGKQGADRKHDQRDLSKRSSGQTFARARGQGGRVEQWLELLRYPLHTSAARTIAAQGLDDLLDAWRSFEL